MSKPPKEVPLRPLVLAVIVGLLAFTGAVFVIVRSRSMTELGTITPNEEIHTAWEILAGVAAVLLIAVIMLVRGIRQRRR